jgi:hypothetical protein
MWSVKASTMAEHDAYLVITFVGATHVLAMNSADELDESSIEAFNTDAMTLFCGSLDNDHIIQVRAQSLSKNASVAVMYFLFFAFRRLSLEVLTHIPSVWRDE